MNQGLAVLRWLFFAHYFFLLQVDREHFGTKQPWILSELFGRKAGECRRLRSVSLLNRSKNFIKISPSLFLKTVVGLTVVCGILLFFLISNKGAFIL